MTNWYWRKFIVGFCWFFWQVLCKNPVGFVGITLVSEPCLWLTVRNFLPLNIRDHSLTTKWSELNSKRHRSVERITWHSKFVAAEAAGAVKLNCASELIWTVEMTNEQWQSSGNLSIDVFKMIRSFAALCWRNYVTMPALVPISSVFTWYLNGDDVSVFVLALLDSRFICVLMLLWS